MPYEHLFECADKSVKALKKAARALGRRANAADAAFLEMANSEDTFDIVIENGHLVVLCGFDIENQGDMLCCLSTAPWIAGMPAARNALADAIADNLDSDKTEILKTAVKCMPYLGSAGDMVAAAAAEKWPAPSGSELDGTIADFWTAAFAADFHVPEAWKTDAMRVAHACADEGKDLFEALDKFAGGALRRPLLKEVVECRPEIFRKLPEKLRSPNFVQAAIEDLENIIEIPKECLSLPQVWEAIAKRLDRLPRGCAPTLLHDLTAGGFGPSEMPLELLDALVACDRENFLDLILFAKENPDERTHLLLREIAVHARCEEDRALAYSDVKDALAAIGLSVAPKGDSLKHGANVLAVRRTIYANLWEPLEDDAEVLDALRKTKSFPELLNDALSNPLQKPSVVLAAEAWKRLQHGQTRDEVVSRVANRLADGMYGPDEIAEFFPPEAFRNPDVARKFITACPRIVLETPLLQTDEWMAFAAAADPEIETAYARPEM